MVIESINLTSGLYSLFFFKGKYMIVKSGNKWKLMNHDGTEVLGEFDTKEEAEKRERQINYFKHLKETVNKDK